MRFLARLAASVNIIPGARSIYRWKGKVEDTTEWLLLIKSRRERTVRSYSWPKRARRLRAR